MLGQNCPAHKTGKILAPSNSRSEPPLTTSRRGERGNNSPGGPKGLGDDGHSRTRTRRSRPTAEEHAHDDHGASATATTSKDGAHHEPV